MESTSNSWYDGGFAQALKPPLLSLVNYLWNRRVSYRESHPNTQHGSSTVLPPLPPQLKQSTRSRSQLITQEMSQDTGNLRSRAISTAKFLMVSQSSSPKQRDVWDAAVRKVITVTEYPMTYNEPDHCSPTSRTPSKRSLLDIISRESGHPDDPHSLESTPNPSLVRSAGNSRNTRSSLTGYQWAGENPTTASAAIQSSGHSSQINADHSSVSSTDPCRSRSMDLPRQQASAVAGAQPGTSVGAARSRRHSVQFPATADYFGRLHEQPVSSSQTTTVPSEAEQGQISKLLNGRSRRGSLLGFPSTTAVAEAADAASMDHYRSGVTSMAPRRSRSLEVTATQRDGSASVSPALASPTTLPAARSFGHGRSSSRMPQVCTASALSSVGAPGASVEAAVPLSPAARGTAATAVLKGYGHQSSACNRPAFGAGQINGDNNAQAVRKNLVDVDAGPEFKPFVPSIEQLDQRALDHPAESDCTHYNVFLTSSVRH